MNKKDVTEAVQKGIYKSFWIPVIIAFTFYLLLFVGLKYYDNYQTQKSEKEHCGEFGCPIADTHCGNLENLNCHVVIGNSTYETNTGYFAICGYQEANAFYEQIKPKIISDFEANKLNFEIRYLECD